MKVKSQLTIKPVNQPNMACNKRPIGPEVVNMKRKNTTQNMPIRPRPKDLTTRSKGQLKRMRLHHTNRGDADNTKAAIETNASTCHERDGRRTVLVRGDNLGVSPGFTGGWWIMRRV